MIYLIPNTAAGRQVADTMRNTGIGKKHGVLLVREDCNGGNKELLEKLLVGVPFSSAIPIAAQPWKPNPTVILLGKAKAKKAEFERMCPGFEKFFGPVTVVNP